MSEYDDDRAEYRRLRLARGTQRQVAAALSITNVTVSNRETGRSPITAEALAALRSLPERAGPRRTLIRYSMTRRRLDRILSNPDLTRRQRHIIQARSGLVGCWRRSLKELAAELGITAEAVRQTEARALRKAKHKTEYWQAKRDGNKPKKSTAPYHWK